jgi:hypothetical protein
MPDFAAVAVAQTEQIPVKPSINPDAFYTYQELEELKLGKYLKFRRAIRAGKLKAHYAGRNVLILGKDLLSYLKGGA